MSQSYQNESMFCNLITGRWVTTGVSFWCRRTNRQMNSDYSSRFDVTAFISKARPSGCVGILALWGAITIKVGETFPLLCCVSYFLQTSPNRLWIHFDQSTHVSSNYSLLVFPISPAVLLNFESYSSHLPNSFDLELFWSTFQVVLAVFLFA